VYSLLYPSIASIKLPNFVRCHNMSAFFYSIVLWVFKAAKICFCLLLQDISRAYVVKIHFSFNHDECTCLFSTLVLSRLHIPPSNGIFLFDWYEVRYIYVGYFLCSRCLITTDLRDGWSWKCTGASKCFRNDSYAFRHC